MVSTSNVDLVFVNVDSAAVRGTGGQQVSFALIVDLGIPHLIHVHLWKSLGRIAVSGAANHESSLVEGLNSLGQHEIVHVFDFYPASAWDEFK